ncbi:unnamed protein product [Oncorhynchus mykiss]|uniref:Succinate dehydrogenase cytochrome b560 subunit, mitochondrial n=1 Tax=Oncorhynchus mykiss TaxID=8022 RepID=A0A060Y4U4_ONCMY|nr:unnamed protein product [Oncorhynchus mykiss]
MLCLYTVHVPCRVLSWYPVSCRVLSWYPVSCRVLSWYPVWSVPMMMSITHRGTGVGLSGGISAFALLALVLPDSYPYYLDLIHSLSIGPALLGLAKFGIAFPLSYHTLNGIRHLFWDSGKGFTLPEVYRSGYVVIALSILTSIAAIAYM